MTIEFINDEGKEKKYGALTTFSKWSNDEWLSIYTELVKRDYPELFKTIEDNDKAICAIGNGINLSERYEALLEMLPQSNFSKAGTHPKWVADAIENNTFDKEITQSDIKDILENKSFSEKEKLAEISTYLKIGKGDLK